jgi:asparagine synthetase B (glutamine-hydrolysing)
MSVEMKKTGDEGIKNYLYSFLRTGMPFEDVPKLHRPKIGSWTPTGEQLLNGLRKEVKDALEDVVKDGEKIGIPLSGGVDSSTITFLVSELYPDRELYTYNIAPKVDFGIDESSYAETVAEKCGTVHKKVLMDEETFINSLKELTRVSPAPTLGSAFYFHVLKVMKNDGVDVVVLGEGGDEILGGYYPGAPAYERYLKFDRFLPTSMKIELFSAFITGLTRGRIAKVCGYNMRNAMKRDVFSHFRVLFEVSDDPIIALDMMRLADIYNRRYPEWIAYCDHLELSPTFPFLHSKDFMDLCISIPKDLRRDDKFGKLILRNALKDHLPEKIMVKEKVGFGLGSRMYHTEPVFSLMKSVLGESSLVKDGLVSGKFVDKYIESNREDWRYKTLLTLTVLELWYKNRTA